MVREAGLNALRRDANSKELTKQDFEEALKKVQPSVSRESAQRYKKIEDHYLKKVKAGMEVGPLYTG